MAKGFKASKGKNQAGEYTFYALQSSPEILKYLVKKGSIAVDGISLTVVELDNTSFSVAIIPHTLKATNLGNKGVGNKVNLEVDIIGKYVEKFLTKERFAENRPAPSGIDRKMLEKFGFGV